MITRLIIKTKSNSYSLTKGAIVLGSDSGIVIQAKEQQNAVYLSLGDIIPSISNSQPGIKTINQISPSSWDNNFYILGSGCTSIITPSVDFSDSLQIWSDSSTSAILGIFDGCLPCRNCDTIAQLQRNLEQCQIWINGLKDCNLYYEDTAAQLWQNMKSKVVQQEANCSVAFSDQILNREESLRRATKLLYQYKALVALWNYLVRTKQGFMHIQVAPQDWGGFIVGSKRAINNCGQDASDSKIVTLDITLTLQNGQNISYLKTRQIDQKPAPQNVRYYVGKAAQNTYIQYGGDTGRGINQDTSSIDFSDSLWYTSDSTITQQIKIYTRFTYTVRKGANTTLSGAVKILPSMSFRKDSSQPIADLISLADWSQIRGGTKQLQQGSDISRNLWLVESQWKFDSDISDSTVFYQARYFNTPYYKLGTNSDSI